MSSAGDMLGTLALLTVALVVLGFMSERIQVDPGEFFASVVAPFLAVVGVVVGLVAVVAVVNVYRSREEDLYGGAADSPPQARPKEADGPGKRKPSSSNGEGGKPGPSKTSPDGKDGEAGVEGAGKSVAELSHPAGVVGMGNIQKADEEPDDEDDDLEDDEDEDDDLEDEYGGEF